MSSPVDDRIVRFLKRHHLMTLATVTGKEIYCCSLFYAYDPMRHRFVVTSSESTRHVQQWKNNPRVAGTIAPESRWVGKLQGIQFQARIVQPEADEIKKARQIYLKRFPFASWMKLELWFIEPDFLKMTDNRLGFGTKLIWKTESFSHNASDESQIS